jgi:hypothetical protein
MDKISDLKLMFQKDMDTVKRGGKAIRIRQFIDNLADEIGLYLLPYDGVLNIASICLEDVNKTHFKNVVKRTWRVSLDEDGTEWIMVNSPIKR